MEHSLLLKEKEKKYLNKEDTDQRSIPTADGQDDQRATGMSITPFSDDGGVKLGQPKNTGPSWGKDKMGHY